MTLPTLTCRSRTTAAVCSGAARRMTLLAAVSRVPLHPAPERVQMRRLCAPRCVLCPSPGSTGFEGRARGRVRIDLSIRAEPQVEKHLPFWVEVEGESVTKRNPNPYRKWAF